MWDHELPRWRDSRAWGWPRWLAHGLAGGVLLMGAAAPAATAADPMSADEDGVERRLSLRLDALELDGAGATRLDLGLSGGRGDSAAVGWEPDTVRLDLVSAPERPRLSGLAELDAELRVLRWPDGAGILERHVSDELGRLLAGASPGSVSSPALAVDVLALGRTVARAWRRWRSQRSETASPVSLTGIARLVVRDADGRPPTSVWVTPIAVGADPKAIEVSCDDAGRCLVEGLPAGTRQLVVCAAGTAIVDLDPATGAAAVWLAAAAEP